MEMPCQHKVVSTGSLDTRISISPTNGLVFVQKPVPTGFIISKIFLLSLIQAEFDILLYLSLSRVGKLYSQINTYTQGWFNKSRDLIFFSRLSHCQLLERRQCGLVVRGGEKTKVSWQTSHLPSAALAWGRHSQGQMGTPGILLLGKEVFGLSPGPEHVPWLGSETRGREASHFFLTVMWDASLPSSG